MKHKSGLVMLALLGAALPVPAQASDHSNNPTMQSVATSDFSSAATKKKKRKHAVVVDAPVRRAYGWRGPDPSLDAYGRPYRPPSYLGPCVFDLGYGRFRSCDSDR